MADQPDLDQAIARTREAIERATRLLTTSPNLIAVRLFPAALRDASTELTHAAETFERLARFWGDHCGEYGEDHWGTHRRAGGGS